MQIADPKPLIAKFRAGTFRESEIAPYFIGFMLLGRQSYSFARPGTFTRHGDAWFFWLLIWVISIGSFFYLKKKNGGTFGDRYLQKFFAFGWVAMVRMTPFFLLVVLLANRKPELFTGTFVAASWVVLKLVYFGMQGKWFAQTLTAPENRSDKE